MSDHEVSEAIRAAGRSIGGSIEIAAGALFVGLVLSGACGAAPVAAQEPPAPAWPPPVEEPAEEPEATEPEPVEPLPGLYLSAWCSLSRGSDDAVATCDQGLAGALASWDPGEPGGLRTSWVLFGGAETVGTGGAISRRISEQVVLGLGAGVVIPIPEDGGIDLKDARACVGITASFW